LDCVFSFHVEMSSLFHSHRLYSCSQLKHFHVSSILQAPKMSKNALKRITKANLALETQSNLFSNFYSPQFGLERWNVLVESLRKPIKHVAMVNKYANFGFASQLLHIQTGQTVPYLQPYFNNVYIHKSHIQPSNTQSPDQPISSTCSQSINDTVQHNDNNDNGNQQQPNLQLDEEDLGTSSGSQVWPAPGLSTSLDPDSGLCCYYPLDVASLFPVLLLDVQPNHHVLDMCSAPGGKALAILQHLDFLSNSNTANNSDNSNNNINNNKAASLTCNDISPDRRFRLKSVLHRYIPSDFQEHIHILASDAASSRFTYQFQFDDDNLKKFDRVLLDAPCSSERHVLLASSTSQNSNNSEMLQWAPGRIKANAERQIALLMNAITVCEMYGKIVYSTCALHSLENDQVIEKVFKKLHKKSAQLGYSLQVLSIPQELARITAQERSNSTSMPFGDATKYGWHILPDNSDGWGPIYLSVLQKIPFQQPSDNMDCDDDDEQ